MDLRPNKLPFFKVHFTGTHSPIHVLLPIVALQKSGVVVTKTVWPTQLRLFTIWPFAGKKKKKIIKLLDQKKYYSIHFLYFHNTLHYYVLFFHPRYFHCGPDTQPCSSGLHGCSPYYISYHSFLALWPEPSATVISSTGPNQLDQHKYQNDMTPTFDFDRSLAKERTLPRILQKHKIDQ